MNKARLLRHAFDGLHFSGATSLGRHFFRGVGAIFCLHHVCPGGGRQMGFAPNSKLECEPEFLAEIISLVRQRGYEILSLADALDHLQNPAPQQKPFAVFTLDDGYIDNQAFAQPVFQKTNCPYTIFVAPRIADGTSELWWRLLELILLQNNHFKSDIAGKHIDLPLQSENEKHKAWNVLLPIIEGLEQFEQRRIVRGLCQQYGIDPDHYCQAVAMNWDALRAIATDPLCTIGAHTINHHSVGHMSSEQAYEQLHQSRIAIEEQLQRPVLFNAYPYGAEHNATPRDFVLAEKAGYKASVTTRKGVVYPGHAAHLQALPRIMISGRFQELRYVDAMLSGLPTALSNKFRKVNVT